MARYTFPDTYAEEVTSAVGPISKAATGIGGLQAITAKGPIAVPIRTRNFEAWEKIYGTYENASRGDAAYEAKLFFDEGGFELITVRQGHFTDLNDKTSYTGGIAFSTAKTAGAGATAAEFTSGSGPFALNDGDDFDIDVDNGGVNSPTFNGVAGYVDDTSTWPLAGSQAGKTVIVTINGVQQTAILGAFTALDDIIDDLNGKLTGCQVLDNGSSQIRVRSDINGTDGVIGAPSGTSDITWAAPTAPTGNVADLSVVTAAEALAIIIAATTPSVTGQDNGDETFTIYSPTTGTSSELDFQSALAALGVTIQTINGTAAGATYDTLKFEAGYLNQKSPGVAGNNLSRKITRNPKHASAGAGSDIAVDITAADTSFQVASLAGLNPKSVIEITDGTNTEYFEVDDVRTVLTGGSVTFFVDVTAGAVNGYVAANTTMQSMEFDVEIFENGSSKETWSQMSMLDTADDYVETLMNDEDIGSKYVVVTDLDASPPGLGADTPATDAAAVALASGSSEITGLVDNDWIGTSTGKTGLYAWDLVNEFMPFCTLGNNEASVIHAGALYAASRIWFDYLTYIDEGMSKADAIATRQNVWGINSSYCFIYAGGAKVQDPAGAGKNPTRSISGLGGVMGVYGRVDSLPVPNGGPWQSPAGEGEYGTLNYARDVATFYDSTDSGEMNEVGINVIRKDGETNPVEIWGSRTCDATTKQKFKYIATRRAFQFYEKSITAGTRWAVFRNNDFRLWRRLENKVDEFLGDLMPERAFPTDVKELAFYVKSGIDKGVMDQADKDAGYVITEVGCSKQVPGEFIVFRFSQYEAGVEVTEV